jgi:hypothetical protein
VADGDAGAVCDAGAFGSAVFASGAGVADGRLVAVVVGAGALLDAVAELLAGGGVVVDEEVGADDDIPDADVPAAGVPGAGVPGAEVVDDDGAGDGAGLGAGAGGGAQGGNSELRTSSLSWVMALSRLPVGSPAATCRRSDGRRSSTRISLQPS